MWERVAEWMMQSGAGMFAVLFVVLLAWVLKTNDSREQRYISVVEKQAQALTNFREMRDDIKELRDWLWQTARNGARAHDPTR